MSSSHLPQGAPMKAHPILLSVSAPFNLSRIIHGNTLTIPAFEISQFAFRLLVLQNGRVLSCPSKITNMRRILRSLMRMVTYYHKGIADSRHFTVTKIISPFAFIQGRDGKDIFNRNSNFSSLEGKAWFSDHTPPNIP